MLCHLLGSLRGMTPLLQADQVSYSYPLRGLVLDQADLSLHADERVSLEGGNGAECKLPKVSTSRNGRRVASCSVVPILLGKGRRPPLLPL